MGGITYTYGQRTYETGPMHGPRLNHSPEAQRHGNRDKSAQTINMQMQTRRSLENVPGTILGSERHSNISVSGATSLEILEMRKIAWRSRRTILLSAGN